MGEALKRYPEGSKIQGKTALIVLNRRPIRSYRKQKLCREPRGKDQVPERESEKRENLGHERWGNACNQISRGEEQEGLRKRP